MSIGFFRQEFWRGLQCLPLGDLPDPGIKVVSPASPELWADYFTAEPQRWKKIDGFKIHKVLCER